LEIPRKRNTYVDRPRRGLDIILKHALNAYVKQKFITGHNS
jgi:hypothetical protein